MNKILYYPYIELPEVSWTVNSLLYWDEVGTIFPASYESELSDSDSFNGILFREGAIKKVSAKNYGFNAEWFNSKLIGILKSRP